MLRSWRLHVGVLIAYATVAIAFSWPLALHLGTRVTGGTGGDTGVYVWNQWVFRHELVENRSFPYFTNVLFGPDHRTDLSLHNYTTFQDLVATPLASFFSVVETFNIVYLLMVVLTAYSTFLLARHVTRGDPESFLAGLLFAWSPVLVTRGMGHFSLVAAAPLAIFLLILTRAEGHERLRDALALGLTMAWAATTDVYYPIFCLLIGAVFLVTRVVSFEPRRPAARTAARTAGRERAVRALNVAILFLAGLVVAIAVSGGWELTLAGQTLRTRSLYTPVLMLTVVILIRLAQQYRPSLVALTRNDVLRFVGLTAATAVAAAIFVAPALYAAAVRIAQGEFDTPSIYWRSSPPGVDLLSLILPNPNHPLAPDGLAQWLSHRPNGYLENVASLPLVAIGILVLAWRAGWRPSRRWTAMIVMFGLLALGPFVHVAGINTYVPGPWALLRYVPLIGLVHTPARFSIVLILAVAVVMADALAELGRRSPERRRALLLGAGLLLGAELLPAPLTLYSAEIPPLYQRVAAAPSTVILLEIPYGVRDGVSSVGDFSARTQFFQTAHGKTVMGGYMSRIPRRRVEELQMDPVARALAILSEKGRLQPADETAMLDAAPEFLRHNRIGFVVIDHDRTDEAFEALVIKAFRLRHVETNGSMSLFATDVLPGSG
jgi:hypothetical protein